jgi:hypothetical protein
MKSLRFLLFFFVIFIAMNQFVSSNPNNDNKDNDGQVFLLSSDPVNNFLDFKIKSEFLQKDSLKTSLKIEVKILNQKGILVFSATKSISEFTIFTGGLPEGAYTILCKVCNTQSQKNFAVKH